MSTTVVTKTCSISGCKRAYKGRGYCDSHLYRLRNGLDVNAPLRRNNKYSDGKPAEWRIDPNGYVVRLVPCSTNKTGYLTQMEHRMVMERFLGRKLLKGENVHHKNGIRSDNRIDNLELWSTAQPAGQRVSDKVTYALEILSLYAPERLI